jgi:hypothetical protein
MTDRGPDLDETRISDELATWFAGEVRQAELDLRRAPLRPARARRGPARGIAAPAAGAILVVVLVVAGISRLPSLAGPATEPTGSAIPSSSVTASEPAATATPAPTGVIEGRYGDGIPMDIDGEPVLRIPSLDLAPADVAPFLLGAWTIDWTGIVSSCGLQSGTPPPFGPRRCNTRWLSDGPAHSPLLFLDSWPSMPAGPVVVKVHRHDDRAELCGAADREACEAMAVIEDVAWTSDQVTAAAPIGAVSAVGRALSGERLQDVTLEAGLPPDPGVPAGAASEPDISWPVVPCEPQAPALSWTVLGGAVSHILVFPTTAAREAVDQSFLPTGWIGADGCQTLADSMHSSEWIAVENVMVSLLVDVDGPTAEQAALAEAIRVALERR